MNKMEILELQLKMMKVKNAFIEYLISKIKLEGINDHEFNTKHEEYLQEILRSTEKL